MSQVGLLFPGEMGALVGAAVHGEVLWASEGRSDATAQRAESAGLRDVGTVRELVAASEIVISVCPPAIAEETAGEVAAEGFARNLRRGQCDHARASHADRELPPLRRRLGHRPHGRQPLSLGRRG